jgi:hypothetical protein
MFNAVHSVCSKTIHQDGTSMNYNEYQSLKDFFKNSSEILNIVADFFENKKYSMSDLEIYGAVKSEIDFKKLKETLEKISNDSASIGHLQEHGLTGKLLSFKIEVFNKLFEEWDMQYKTENPFSNQKFLKISSIIFSCINSILGSLPHFEILKEIKEQLHCLLEWHIYKTFD